MPTEWLPKYGRNVAVVFAHPDDEVVGIGAHMPEMPEALFICVTNGSPPDPADAQRAACDTPEEYSEMRHRELVKVLGACGIAPERHRWLGFGDQQASFHLKDLCGRLATLFLENEIARVFTHPFEGGHPDHDATAYGVHSAKALLQERSESEPEIWEFTSYFEDQAGFGFGRFKDDAPGEVVVPLSPERRELKRQLLKLYRSQGAMLEGFDVSTERFRPSPGYDFARHTSPPLYEKFPWGMTSEQWAELVRKTESCL